MKKIFSRPIHETFVYERRHLHVSTALYLSISIYNLKRAYAHAHPHPRQDIFIKRMLMNVYQRK